MKLYFSPLACSLATRIALYEAGADATYVEVDLKTKKTLDGQDYLAVHPLGQVPLLEVDGAVVTENAAVLQLLAERFPALGPRDAMERVRLQEWLGFIGTELHKGIFATLFDRASPPAEAKRYALSKADARMQYLASKLEGRELLFDAFSVADAYLFTVLNWAQVTPIDLARWPSVQAYLKRLYRRPSVARAVEEERPLYLREQARHAAA
jgi:glutathione S-transferase